MHGTLQAVLAQAPRTAACPQCRQTGVYRDAMLMKKLSHAISRRCPVAAAAPKCYLALVLDGMRILK